MQQKVSYALVGLFVIILGCASIAVSLWLAFGDFHRTYDTYVVYMNESVSGLYVDAPVKYRGVETGKVSDIALDEDNPEVVRVVIDVEPAVPIKEDTVAKLAVQGLTGIAFIELTGGSRESEKLTAKPGQDHPVIAAAPSLFVRLDSAISDLITNINRFTEDIHALLNPEAIASLQNTLTHVETVLGTLAARQNELDVGITHVATTFENVAQASQQLPEVMESVAQSARAIQAMADQLAQAGSGVNRTVQGSGRDLETFSGQTLPEVGQLVGEMRQLATTLERLGRDLEDDPRVFLFGNSRQPPGPGE